jgi:translation initiation factor IF-2
LGLDSVPRVGEKFQIFTDLEKAREYAEAKISKKEQLGKTLELESGQKVLNLILKTDVLGSIEAIEGIISQLPQEKIVLKMLKSEVGQINENDIKLAKSAQALILAFRIKISPNAKDLAQRQKVTIMNFDIVYDLVEGLRKFMERSLKPETVKTQLATMKVLVSFWSSKNRQIVGGRITEGEAKKGSLIEVIRDDEVIDSGKMINLQKNKKDVERAVKGEEAGILYEGQKRIQKGDMLSIYVKETKKAEL